MPDMEPADVNQDMAKSPTLVSILASNTGHGARRPSQVFEDFCALSALAVRNSIDKRGFDAREAEYLAIACGYESEEMTRFAEALAALTLALEAQMGDVLGEAFMQLGAGNTGLGQFFTPYAVSQLTAQLALGEQIARAEWGEVITITEPACGSGGMVIAAAEALASAGIKYQQRLHVTAQDVSAVAVHMTYLQLSLLGIPAVVLRGDTLSGDLYDVWRTPAHVLGGWEFRRFGDLPSSLVHDQH